MSALLLQEQQLEQGEVPYQADTSDKQPSPAEDPGHNTGGSGSSIEWWTKNSHFGAATADLQQQAKQVAAAAGSSSVAVLAAPSAGTQFLAGDAGPASSSSDDDNDDDDSDDVTASTEGSAGFVAGQDVFLLGLRSYLQDLSYQNSNYTTLWQHLEAASGQPVSHMMKTWTLRR